MMRIVVLSAIALAVMAGITILAITQRARRARRPTSRGHGSSRPWQCRSLQVDPQRSLDLAVQSARRKPTSEIEDVLRQALISARERAVAPEREPGAAAFFSPAVGSC